MGENQKSSVGNLESLAEIADNVQKLYKGRTTVVFELETEEYKKTQSMFREIDSKFNQFKIDISGTEFIFILTGNDV